MYLSLRSINLTVQINNRVSRLWINLIAKVCARARGEKKEERIIIRRGVFFFFFFFFFFEKLVREARGKSNLLALKTVGKSPCTLRLLVLCKRAFFSLSLSLLPSTTLRSFARQKFLEAFSPLPFRFPFPLLHFSAYTVPHTSRSHPLPRSYFYTSLRGEQHRSSRRDRSPLQFAHLDPRMPL